MTWRALPDAAPPLVAVHNVSLVPLGRRHYQAKEAPGWHLSQPEPGLLTWTTPSGRRYTTVPEPYPS
jgi:hypothetical protein